MIYLPTTDDPLAQDMLRAAYIFASFASDDIHTKVGAVLVNQFGEVVSRGANRLPPMVEAHPERLERPQKYLFLEHAERDVLYPLHVQPWGTTMYAPWAACADCARAIVSRGVDRVVTHRQIMESTPDRWVGSIQAAREMLEDAGIMYEWYDGKIGDCEALFDGKVWYP